MSASLAVRLYCRRFAFAFTNDLETESKHGHMRELRTQHEGRPYRRLYAFDPRRAAILLIGGDKKGNDRWYESHTPLADKLYDEHLEELKMEEN